MAQIDCCDFVLPSTALSAVASVDLTSLASSCLPRFLRYVQGYLLLLLEKEQANETERARLLAAVDDVGDQRRLEKIFALERAKASEAIKQLTRQHERTLALKMHELGMISDDDDDEHFP